MCHVMPAKESVWDGGYLACLWDEAVRNARGVQSQPGVYRVTSLRKSNHLCYRSCDVVRRDTFESPLHSQIQSNTVNTVNTVHTMLPLVVWYSIAAGCVAINGLQPTAD
jgi:hypothetical protein